MATNVRLQPESYSKLKEMAADARLPMSDILAEAIDALYRQRFLDECNRAYAKLKADPQAWKEELAERRAGESTLGDLEDQ